MQPALHGFRLERENLGGLFHIHPLDHAGDEDETKRLRQFVDGVLDDSLNFALGHGFFRIGGGGEGELDDLGFERALQQRVQFHGGPPAAQPAQRLVHGDPRQPGRQAGIAAKTFQMREGADVGLLHDILGLAVVAQDAAGEPVEPAVVRLHDGADRGFVAGQRPPHQFGVSSVERRALRYVCLAHDGSTNNRVLGLDAAEGKGFPKHFSFVGWVRRSRNPPSLQGNRWVTLR